MTFLAYVLKSLAHLKSSNSLVKILKLEEIKIQHFSNSKEKSITHRFNFSSMGTEYDKLQRRKMALDMLCKLAFQEILPYITILFG